MNVTVLYHPKSDHERQVIEFEENFKRQTDRMVDLLSLETVEGSSMAKLYDVMQYPAVVATSDDGVVQKVWQGDLPLINEVSYYARENVQG